ncbi:hypothetical protein ExPUPEC79_03706 [Escherichia coli]|nr:hypothetical protein HmCmsJML102_02130 [Escherichia coli]GCY28889.1 hypothetical protein HmCmsJML114_04856 [Escherichia coli]GDV01008.1 hypothetical protein ExPUPEC79_03706 [Escherichia coli]
MRSREPRRKRRTSMPKLIARSSPRRSAVSCQARRSDQGKTIAIAAASTASFSHDARARLPIVQNTRPCKVSSSATNCIMDTSALKVNTSAIPNSTTPDVGTRVQRVRLSSSRADRSAKRKAFAGINPLSGTPGIPMPRTIASAAPKAAADETPSVNGLARELFRIVCISAPAKPSAIPTRSAISA